MNKRCYNCQNGNKADKESLKICKSCGLPFHRKNWKPIIPDGYEEEAILIIKKLLCHCRALKVLIGEDVPKLNENIKIAEDFLREVEK